MRKFIAVALSVLMVTGLAACASGKSVDFQTPGTSSAESPGLSARWEVSADISFDNDDERFIRVGKDEDGTDTFAFVRFTIGTDFFADELAEAKAFFKLNGEKAPKSLKLALLPSSWDESFFERDEAIKALSDAQAVSVDVTEEKDGWLSLPVTSLVQTWLKGEAQNNGFAIFAEENGEAYSFSGSKSGEEKSEVPYMSVLGTAGDRALDYGKFGYTKTPLPNTDDMGGNCMSYALRDVNMIMSKDMGIDDAVLAEKYQAGGVDAMAEYTAEKVLEYVNAHKEGLEFSDFRRIDSYDYEIDVSKEYRIAMRIGVDKYAAENGDIDFSDKNAYDYHFWLQLNDGRWAQKYPTGDSLIVPCTAHDIDPAGYPWDAGYNWSDKNRDYYTSKAVYFAVTKDTDEITRHRGELEDRDFSV